MLFESGMIAQQTHCAMGTIVSHKAFGIYAEESLLAVRSEIERLEKLFSRFLPQSEISLVNQAAGIRSEKVSLDTFEVLSTAVEFSAHCRGLLDITINPLVDLWCSAKDSFSPPDETKIKDVLALVNYTDLYLDAEQRTAGLHNIGQSIDLGGIGKGYTANKIVEMYQTFGIRSAFSNLGGNVVTLGTKPDGSPWKIGIRHPRQEKRLIGVVSAVNQTVVTSGDYQRYFTGKNGKRYHHILDPLNGYPAESGLISVSIVTDDSMTADALSTMVFMAGMEKGLELLRGYPQTEAILVDSDEEVFVTKGLIDCFQADKSIRLNNLH